MALIKCPECSREISDSAGHCPHCGYKLPKSKAAISKSKQLIVLIGLIVVALGVLFLGIAFACNFSGHRFNHFYSDSLDNLIIGGCIALVSVAIMYLAFIITKKKTVKWLLIPSVYLLSVIAYFIILRINGIEHLRCEEIERQMYEKEMQRQEAETQQTQEENIITSFDSDEDVLDFISDIWWIGPDRDLFFLKYGNYKSRDKESGKVRNEISSVYVLEYDGTSATVYIYESGPYGRGVYQHDFEVDLTNKTLTYKPSVGSPRVYKKAE